ncbi:MAG: TRAP transporter large permease [Planctomycetes bacterium]|mgnify:CR=1 FL=1|nr:TRAP transporter large permease [Planctomycetota bacterium]
MTFLETLSPLQIGIAGCAALLVLLATSMPVGFAMALVGMVGFGVLRDGVDPALSMSAGVLRSQFSSPSLTVIPLFVLMGQVSFHSGISRRLFNAAYHWLGWLPGGLAMATVGACTAFGAICGSGPATSATMAAVALPEMKRFKYSMELGCGTVAAGGSLGMLIPPSVVLIAYGVMTRQDIDRLFIAGIVPGLMIAGMFCVAILIQCLRRPELGPAAAASTWKQRIFSLAGVLETLALFALVMGGMFAGWFTPTQAAAIGAAGSLIIAALRRKLTVLMLRQSLMETVRTSCMVLLIVAGATMFGRFLALTQIPQDLADWMGGLALPGFLVMGLIILFYLLAGCFVDALALMLLTVSIFEPVVARFGYDLVWFGVLIVVVTQMGVISPPVGVCVYVVSGIERDVPLGTIFRGSLPFLLALIAASAVLVAFPDIALWLPRLVR